MVSFVELRVFGANRKEVPFGVLESHTKEEAPKTMNHSYVICLSEEPHVHP